MKQLFNKIYKAIYYWYYYIPFTFGIFALIAYFLIMFVLYGGTISTFEIKRNLDDLGIGMFWGFVVPFMVPCFVSFYSLFIGNSHPNALNSQDGDTLDRVLEHRDMMVKRSSAIEASEILQKTSYLDTMKNNSSNKALVNARKGFNARFGQDSSSKALRDLIG